MLCNVLVRPLGRSLRACALQLEYCGLAKSVTRDGITQPVHTSVPVVGEVRDQSIPLRMMCQYSTTR